MAKAELTGSQLAIASFLAAFTVPAPLVIDPVSGERLHWVVGASHKVICEGTGFSENTVRYALYGDKRADKAEMPSYAERARRAAERRAAGVAAAPSQLGLIRLGVVVCWDSGQGQGEGVYSLSGHFEEWAIRWRPVEKATNPTALRDVLNELKIAGFAAPWGAVQRYFFTAPQGAVQGSGSGRKARKSGAWLPWVRLKGKVGFRAPWGAVQNPALGAPQGARELGGVEGGSPLPENASHSPTENQAAAEGYLTEKDLPAPARRIVATIKRVTNKASFFDSHVSQPITQLVEALLDAGIGEGDDVGWVCEEIRRHGAEFGPTRWKAAFDLAETCIMHGRPGEQRACPDCGGAGWIWVMVDDREVTAPCPTCHAPEAAGEGG